MICKCVALMLIISVFLALKQGDFSFLSLGIYEGTEKTVDLLFSIGGGICFWSGICKVMESAKITDKISRLLGTFIRLLFKNQGREFESLISTNMTANILGLGNMATPTGLKAAKILWDKGKVNLIIRLIVLNSASIQLLPTTLCTIRAAQGSKAPFDILPAVWISSIFSVSIGLLLCVLLEGRNEK